MVKVPKIRVRRGKAESSLGQPLGSASPFPTNDEIVQVKSRRRGDVLIWEDGEEKYTLRYNGTIFANNRDEYVGKLPEGTDLEDFIRKIFAQKYIVHYLHDYYAAQLRGK